jgi:hypothetical protein
MRTWAAGERTLTVTGFRLASCGVKTALPAARFQFMHNPEKSVAFSARRSPAGDYDGMNLIHFEGAVIHRQSLVQVLFDALKSSRQSRPRRRNF